MNNYVADTMAIVLYLESRKLPNGIKSIFDDAANKRSIIYISAVSLMEIGYLSEKQRIDISIATTLQITESNNNFAIYALDSVIVSEAFKIKNIPELHDRLITATASVLRLPLITNDPIIQRSQYVETIW